MGGIMYLCMKLQENREQQFETATERLKYE